MVEGRICSKPTCIDIRQTPAERPQFLELGRFGCTANAIAPGMVVTDMTATTAQRLGMSFEDFQAAAAAQVAVGRCGTPQDIAALFVWLSSEDASYITGGTHNINGGAYIA